MNPKSNNGWNNVKDKLPLNYLSVLLFDAIDKDIFIGYMNEAGEFQLEGYDYEYSSKCCFTH